MFSVQGKSYTSKRSHTRKEEPNYGSCAQINESKVQDTVTCVACGLFAIDPFPVTGLPWMFCTMCMCEDSCPGGGRFFLLHIRDSSKESSE